MMNIGKRIWEFLSSGFKPKPSPAQPPTGVVVDPGPNPPTIILPNDKPAFDEADLQSYVAACKAGDFVSVNSDLSVEKVGGDEIVMVVPSEPIDKLMGKTGLMQEDPEQFLSEAFWSFRAPAENDPTSRQIIPYVVLRSGNKYWVYDRTTSGGEERLHGLSSLGWGGHINPEDYMGPSSENEKYIDSVLDAVYNCAQREICEELGLEGLVPSSVKYLGAIVSYASDVDAVHLGLVELWQVPELSELDINLEDSVSNLRLMTLTQLRAEKKNFESWSQIVIQNLNSKV